MNKTTETILVNAAGVFAGLFAFAVGGKIVNSIGNSLNERKEKKAVEANKTQATNTKDNKTAQAAS